MILKVKGAVYFPENKVPHGIFLTKQEVFDIMKAQLINALIRMVGTGEQGKNMSQRRNCKKSATSVAL